jgi:hypothetical protein
MFMTNAMQQDAPVPYYCAAIINPSFGSKLEMTSAVSVPSNVTLGAQFQPVSLL